MNNKPYVWQMVKEAVDHLANGILTYPEIKKYIWEKYGDVNEGTINAQIIVCTVNQPSRVRYPMNQKPRSANSRYDFLFSVGHGQVVPYEPSKHGHWVIRKDSYGKLTIAQSDVAHKEKIPDGEVIAEDDEQLAFPFESHLRDFIANNLDSISVRGKQLELYVDQQQRNGIEYPTSVGFIDILAKDEDQSFVVFELKLSKGEDRTVGQLLRYMGWVNKNLPNYHNVRGVIVAQEMSDHLKYAVSMLPDVDLFEYEVSFTIKPVDIE